MRRYLHTLTPPGIGDFVAVTPATRSKMEASPQAVWHWMTGNDPYVGRDPDEFSEHDRRFYFESVPDHVALSERLMPGLQRVLTTLAQLQMVGPGVADVEGIPEFFADQAIEGLGMARRHIEMNKRSSS